VDLAYPALPDSERFALKQSLEAAAIPHWCDEAILAALLEIPKQESAARFARLRNLSVLEPFPAIAARMWRIHRIQCPSSISLFQISNSSEASTVCPIRTTAFRQRGRDPFRRLRIQLRPNRL
jgi:hypothetical protein